MLDSEITVRLISYITNVQDPEDWARLIRLMELGIVTRDDLRAVASQWPADSQTQTNALLAQALWMG
jgi:hypothetical protein